MDRSYCALASSDIRLFPPPGPWSYPGPVEVFFSSPAIACLEHLIQGPAHESVDPEWNCTASHSASTTSTKKAVLGRLVPIRRVALAFTKKERSGMRRSSPVLGIHWSSQTPAACVRNGGKGAPLTSLSTESESVRIKGLPQEQAASCLSSLERTRRICLM
jgi:hypothetical protein